MKHGSPWKSALPDAYFNSGEEDDVMVFYGEPGKDQGRKEGGVITACLNFPPKIVRWLRELQFMMSAIKGERGSWKGGQSKGAQ